ncbi:MAG: hypothetical protein NT055_04060, partial [Nitrospirae bacterium]|nr:hypothetical protein [Nitrospirota bacterium]
MTWEILISSFALSFIILVPLGIKWEIPKRVTVPASFFIGILTGLIIMSIEGIYDIKFWQVLILEL